MGKEMKGRCVDRGGVRKANGKLDNLNFVGGSKAGREVSFESHPPACDTTSLEPALEEIKRLINNPDKAAEDNLK